MKIHASVRVVIALSFAVLGVCPSRAEPAANDRYQAWRQSGLNNLQAYRAYRSTAPDFLERAVPNFDGWTFSLRNYNQSTYRNVTDIMTQFQTQTIITTNTTTSVSTSFNTYELYNQTSTAGSLSAMDWVGARSNYLQNNFGMASDEATNAALADRSFCDTNPDECAGRMFTTNYQLDIIGPDVSTRNGHSSSTTSTSNRGSTNVHNGNTTVRTTVTNNTTTRTNTNTSTEELRNGTRDTVTSATGTNGGENGTVSTNTTTDERTTVDETTNETTTTETRNERTTDEETRTETTRRVRGERKWDLQIAPMVFFNADFDRNITSLQSYYPSVNRLVLNENGDLVAAASSSENTSALRPQAAWGGRRSPPSLTIENAGGPYRVELHHRVTLGVGAVLNAVQLNASGIEAFIIPYIGVAPTGSLDAVSERTVKTLDSAHSIGGLKLPRDADDLAEWKNFDRLNYTTEGGILLVGGISMPGLDVSASYVANGTWSTEVQKVDRSRVYVKITSSQLRSFGMATSAAVLVTLSENRFSTWSRGFSYMFDLSDSAGASAYRQLLKGNAVPAQRLADQTRLTSVIRVESQRTTAKGTVRGIRFGLPGLNVSSSRGEVLAAELSEYHPDGVKLEADYGIFLKERDSNFFGMNTHYSFGFYGSAYKAKKGDEPAEQSQFGMVGWSFKTSDVDQGKLQKAINRLVMQTGLRNELAVKVGGGNRNRGYANIEFSLKFDANAVATLEALARNNDMEDLLGRISTGFNDSLLRVSATDDAQGPSLTKLLVEEYSPSTQPAQGPHGNARALSASERMSITQRKLKSETKDAIEDMSASLKKMLRARDARDRKAYVKEFGLFGKAMIKNPIAFQTVFNLLKGRGVSARYVVSGEAIKSYDLSFDWAPRAETASRN